MKMLFVYPDWQTHQFAHIQHGIASISAVLRATGHQADLIWIREKWTEEQFLRAVEDRSPDLVGFSTTALQWPYARNYSRALKAARPDLPLVIGGVHATLVPDQVWAEGTFDALCIGEGEYPMRDLLEALSRGRDYRQIPNWWVRDGEDTVKNPLRPWIRPGRWRSRRVFETMLDPKHRIEDRRWHDHELSLENWGGRLVEITLGTRTPPGENQYCVAVWSRPHLVEPG